MKTIRFAVGVAALFLFGLTPMAFADGMVFSEPLVRTEIEIPNQQALIHFADGVEDLVIETSFLGEGTNYAWVVPLPSVPKITPVSGSFFPGLQQAFQPRLIHDVHRYYVSFLFVCGLSFLAWRSFKSEVAWVYDLPLCVLLAAGVWFFGKSLFLAFVVLGCLLYVRILVSSIINLTVVILIGLGLASVFTFFSDSRMFSPLIMTLGSEPEVTSVAGVDVMSVRHAGIFDSTIIRSSDSRAVMQWLEKNGYDAPKTVEPAVSRYIKEGWVFVASKVRRDAANGRLTSMHPLAFSFATSSPVYPMRLTAAAGGNCVVDLYVFGEKRAKSRLFSVKRCDRIVQNEQSNQHHPGYTWLRISDLEVLNRIGRSTVGTKLSARLNAATMDSDVEIGWRSFWKKGAVVYSDSGALTVALNIALMLAPLAWLSVSACRGSWGVDAKFIRRWRGRLLMGTLAAGIITYILLPKVPIVIDSPVPAYIEQP